MTKKKSRSLRFFICSIQQWHLVVYVGTTFGFPQAVLLRDGELYFIVQG